MKQTSTNETTHKTAKNVEFLDAKATIKLRELAQHPFDLTQPWHLTPERIEKYQAEAVGYKLLYGTERIDDQVMQSLERLAQETDAIEKMRAMQAGEILNVIHGYPSENRPALHTATRDFFDHPQKSPDATQAANLARKEIEKLKAFIANIEAQKHFTDLILIGIGGSELGPKANYLALEHLKKPNRRIFFIGNVDPDDTAAVLRQANLKHALVVVISKSGTTIETATNEAFLRDRFIKEGLKPEAHFVSVTSQGSPLDDSQKYLESFYMWDWIGGRYSTTSMVGGVLLAFAFGFDVYWEFLKGAHAMDEAACKPDIKHNLPLLDALLALWNRDFLKHPTTALIPYSQALVRYPAHIQQVEMESNGKRIDKFGHPVHFETSPIIWGEPGTNAQHSFFQLLHQGTTIVPVEFIGFAESQYGDDFIYKETNSQEKLLANLFAQAIALATGQANENPNKVFPGNRPSRILLGKKLTPYALGALLAFFEHRVAFEGFILGINSFDQEGVQLGKVLATQLTEEFAARRISKHKERQPSLGRTFIKLMDGLK